MARNRIGLSRAVRIAAAACGILAAPLGASPAGAEAIAGSVSVEIPGTPEDLRFSVTINGERRDNETVDNTFSGTLTLAWAASQAEPGWSVEPCEGGATGGRILLWGATPETLIWATYVTPTGQTVLGPFEVRSEQAVAVAGACTLAGDEEPSPGDEGPGPGSSGGGNGNGPPHCSGQPGGCGQGGGPPSCTGGSGDCEQGEVGDDEDDDHD